MYIDLWQLQETRATFTLCSLPNKKLNVGGKKEEGVKWRHTMFRMNQLSLPIWAPTSNLQYRFEKKELGKCFCKAIALGHFDFRVDQLLA